MNRNRGNTPEMKRYIMVKREVLIYNRHELCRFELGLSPWIGMMGGRDEKHSLNRDACIR